MRIQDGSSKVVQVATPLSCLKTSCRPVARHCAAADRAEIVGQAGASPDATEVPSDSPTAMPSPTQLASPIISPPPSAIPAPSAPPQPAHLAPSCPPLVITSFTARAAPGSVVLAWTISGGCGNETGTIGGQFAGTMYPGYWVIPIHAAWRTYTDHPQRPAGSQQSQQCDFTLNYDMGMNGTAPDGRGVPPAFAQVSNVNLC